MNRLAVNYRDTMLSCRRRWQRSESTSLRAPMPRSAPFNRSGTRQLAAVFYQRLRLTRRLVETVATKNHLATRISRVELHIRRIHDRNIKPAVSLRTSQKSRLTIRVSSDIPVQLRRHLQRFHLGDRLFCSTNDAMVRDGDASWSCSKSLRFSRAYSPVAKPQRELLEHRRPLRHSL